MPTTEERRGSGGGGPALWPLHAERGARPRLIRARIAGIWGGSDAFADGRLEACRRVLSSAQADLDFRVIEGAGHWVPYEAAHQINAAFFELLGG